MPCFPILSSGSYKLVGTLASINDTHEWKKRYPIPPDHHAEALEPLLRSMVSSLQRVNLTEESVPIIIDHLVQSILKGNEYTSYYLKTFLLSASRGSFFEKLSNRPSESTLHIGEIYESIVGVFPRKLTNCTTILLPQLSEFVDIPEGERFAMENWVKSFSIPPYATCREELERYFQKITEALNSVLITVEGLKFVAEYLKKIAEISARHKYVLMEQLEKGSPFFSIESEENHQMLNFLRRQIIAAVPADQSFTPERYYDALKKRDDGDVEISRLSLGKKRL